MNSGRRKRAKNRDTGIGVMNIQTKAMTVQMIGDSDDRR
jgi:hypothetical protein